MQQELVKILHNHKCRAASNLNEDIWCAIVAENKRLTRIKLWIFSAVGIASLVSLVLSINLLVGKFSQSGFYEYFSLIFSDTGTMAGAWKEFSMLLAESLPVVSITISLVLVFILFISLRSALRQIIIKDQLSY